MALFVTSRQPVTTVRHALGRIRRSPAFGSVTEYLAVQARRAQQRLTARFVRGVWLTTGDYLAASPPTAAAAFHLLAHPAGRTDVPAPTFAVPPRAPAPRHPIRAAYGARHLTLLLEPYVVGPAGAVVGRDRRLIWDLSYEWPGRPDSHTTYGLRKVHAAPLPGTTATIAAMAADSNYFHFLLNSLARLAYLEGAPPTARPDRYLVSGRVTPFVADALRLFGIERERVIGTADHPALRPERLLAPSLIDHPFVVPAHVCSFLQAKILSAVPLRPATPRRLFIDRSDAPRRRISNLAELQPVLRRHGIEVVRLSGLSLVQQAALFESAELIIANHGAALANLVFCRRETRVLQILAPRMMEREYRTLSMHNRLRHDYLAAEFATVADATLPRKDRDLILAPAVLSQALETDGWSARAA